LTIGEELDVLLHSTLVGKKIITVPHPNEGDIHRFADAICVQPSINSTEPVLPELMLQTITVDLNQKKQKISSMETNDYCRQWGAELSKLAPRTDPLQLRQIIETKKSKLQHDVGQIRKLVEQARMDHYALYKAYLYLKKNPNKDVLLVLLLKDSNDKEAKEVLEVIYNYLVEIEIIPNYDHTVPEKDNKTDTNVVSKV